MQFEVGEMEGQLFHVEQFVRAARKEGEMFGSEHFQINASAGLDVPHGTICPSSDGWWPTSFMTYGQFHDLLSYFPL